MVEFSTKLCGSFEIILLLFLLSGATLKEKRELLKRERGCDILRKYKDGSISSFSISGLIYDHEIKCLLIRFEMMLEFPDYTNEK